MKTIESRNIHIKLVDGTQINGEVNINRGTGYDRLSDLVGDYQENFLTIFNARLHEKSLSPQVKYETILVNKNHILYSTPGGSKE
ncbi:MAG: hypothetical protein GY710_27250 [Desulfobacteraceae bacterium]|nr:hypothetical protein [Desulfobacteraceae bacterium]